MADVPNPRETPTRHRRQLFDSAVGAAAQLLLASEGRLQLEAPQRQALLDTLFAFLEEMNDALPKA